MKKPGRGTGSPGRGCLAEGCGLEAKSPREALTRYLVIVSVLSTEPDR